MAYGETVAQLIGQALARSYKNRGDALATQATELVAVMNRALRTYYSRGADVNPYVFGEQATVPAQNNSWLRPSLAESIWRIELPSATEVIVTELADRFADTTRPAVYRLGQRYYSVGGVLDPGTEDLTFFYSVIAPNLALLTDPIPGTWPDQFNELLVLEVAIHLAIKDGRSEELPALKGEQQRWTELFVTYLMHETTNIVRSVGVPTPSMVPTLRPVSGVVR